MDGGGGGGNSGEGKGTRVKRTWGVSRVLEDGSPRKDRRDHGKEEAFLFLARGGAQNLTYKKGGGEGGSGKGEKHPKKESSVRSQKKLRKKTT